MRHFDRRGDRGDSGGRLGFTVAHQPRADLASQRRGTERRFFFRRVGKADQEAPVRGTRERVARSAATPDHVLGACHCARRGGSPARAECLSHLIQADQPDLAGDVHRCRRFVRPGQHGDDAEAPEVLALHGDRRDIDRHLSAVGAQQQRGDCVVLAVLDLSLARGGEGRTKARGNALHCEFADQAARRIAQQSIQCGIGHLDQPGLRDDGHRRLDAQEHLGQQSLDRSLLLAGMQGLGDVPAEYDEARRR